MSGPLVSVICLCYNHERFVEEAILSVLDQTYPHIEMILVNDASTDNSLAAIKQLVQAHPQIIFVNLEKNLGNCAAFNIGLARSKGEYIIDFATDDVLESSRIEEGINALESAGIEFGVQFSDAELINVSGKILGLHSDKHPHWTIPEGDIYTQLIRRYFLCAPSMLIRREVLELLNGYDESLAYEDFDFWIRSSRHFKYIYIPKVLVKRRVLIDSMRSRQFKRGSSQLKSTYLVCQKISKLNRSAEEHNALRFRLWYELKVCIKLLEISMAYRYLRLLLSL